MVRCRTEEEVLWSVPTFVKGKGMDGGERWIFFVLIPASTLAICCLIALVLG
jgi:hypothetical protein